MSDQGPWDPPPPGGPNAPPGGDPSPDEPQRDSEEDLTVPWTSPLRPEQLEAAGVTPPRSEQAGAPSPFEGAPPAAAQPPEEEGKSKKGLIIGGCASCLGVVLMLCCCSGYLLYLEEGVSYSDPGEEYRSFPLVSGQPISVTPTWEGSGYARIRAYVDLGEDAPETTRVTGRFGCEDYGQLDLDPVDETNLQYGDTPDGWVQLPTAYLYVRDGRRITCQGQLEITPPVSGARLVFTERQRPSDWLSEWF
ncbi:MAG TPA: hypothetical protein RMH99_14875 [Sandaracinaceae bacterium LLY-WYZ-13_1]|nr:hypothetical protein [Sandaracinaceae bacterium LLY-WYZ-13_1]